MALPFVLPTIVGLLVFNVIPLLAAFALGFTNYSFTDETEWIGVANYRLFLFEDPLFWKAMRNTLYYTVASVGLSVDPRSAAGAGPLSGDQGNPLLPQRLLPAGDRLDRRGLARLGPAAGAELRAGELPARASLASRGRAGRRVCNGPCRP